MSTQDQKPESHNIQVYKYSTILSYVLERFIDDNAEYIKESDGKYFIFGKTYKTKFILESFYDYIDDFFTKEDQFPTGKHFTIVLGTCYCHHNWRSAFQNEMEYSNKLRIIKNRIPIRYAIADRRFVCDEEMLNSIFDTMLSNYISKTKSVFTPNWERVKWIFIKNVTEDDLVRIVKTRHSDVKCYPTYKKNFMMDLNNMVYVDIKKNHRLSQDTKFNALHIYEYMIDDDKEI
jgi:hypothetical protein